MPYTGKEEKTKCYACGSENAVMKEWDSSDGAYTDWCESCPDCGHIHWYEGSDA